MNKHIRRSFVGALALASAGAVTGLGGVAQASSGHRDVVFVQTDNVAANTVVVYDRHRDGTLRQAGTYQTGGEGGVLHGSVVDHLASQGSLTYDRRHRLLYAVNAGSNTLTVFAVNGDRLRREQVIDSGGQFPVSVAVHDDEVYVLNARAGGSIQGFLRVGDRLVAVPWWGRGLGLEPIIAPEFVSTPGQVAFSPNGRQLIVTTKVNGNNIEVFNLDGSNGPSSAPVVTADPLRVPFAVDFDRYGHLAVVEAGTNTVARYYVHRDGTLSLIDRTPTGQQASCWIVATHRGLYVSNAATANVSVFIQHRRSLVSAGNFATTPGTVDAAATRNGRNLYVQTGAQGAVDEFRIGRHGELTKIGSVTVPGAIGGEGIAVS